MAEKQGAMGASAQSRHIHIWEKWKHPSNTLFPSSGKAEIQVRREKRWFIYFMQFSISPEAALHPGRRMPVRPEMGNAVRSHRVFAHPAGTRSRGSHADFREHRGEDPSLCAQPSASSLFSQWWEKKASQPWLNLLTLDGKSCFLKAPTFDHTVRHWDVKH